MKQSKLILLLMILIIIISLLTFSEHGLYTLTYTIVSIHCIVRIFTIKGKAWNKLGVIIVYLMILTFQISFSFYVVFGNELGPIKFALAKTIATLFLALPFLLEEAITVNKYATISIPNLSSKDTYSFEALLKLKENTSIINITDVAMDLPRHRIYTYCNKNSLNEAYFNKCNESMNDPYIYLILSDTGSSASNLIKLVTGKNYNHISLSFDDQLQTIVSYNGGENIFPPGLNEEMIEFFNKKEDASIYVYKLLVTRNQKEKMIDYIKAINENGSAYNIVGLLTKTSRRKNIMFCSQFVYKVLDVAGARYFDKVDTYVKPTDFVELDYQRFLKFERRIRFNNDSKISQ